MRGADDGPVAGVDNAVRAIQAHATGAARTIDCVQDRRLVDVPEPPHDRSRLTGRRRAGASDGVGLMRRRGRRVREIAVRHLAKEGADGLGDFVDDRVSNPRDLWADYRIDKTVELRSEEHTSESSH